MGVGYPVPDGKGEGEVRHHLDWGAGDDRDSKPMSEIPTVILSSDQIERTSMAYLYPEGQRKGIPNTAQLVKLFIASSQPRNGISHLPTRSTGSNLQGTKTAEVADPGGDTETINNGVNSWSVP